MNMEQFNFPALAPETPDDPRKDLRIGAAIAALFFVLFLGWAALTPLDAAVRANGVVSVLGNRQSVQHETGGTVTAIHVREGETVRAGEVLIELEAPDIRAAERAMTGDYLSLLAQRERLYAERAGASSFAAPPEFANLSAADRTLAERALSLQRGEMQARASSLSAQQSVLQQRASQLREQQAGYANQRASMAEQRRILGDELEGMREIAKKGFASTNRIRALERAGAELRGQEAGMTAEIARANEAIGETRMQGLSIRQSTQEQIAADLRETETKLSDVLPKLVALRQQLRAAQIRAPVSGRVVGMTIHTVGGVVGPGQVLMDIIPQDRNLVVQAQVAPSDADNVYSGQEAQLRFSGVRDTNLPVIEGTVRTISADSFTDEKSGESFFRAEIDVGPEELRKVQRSIGRGELRPGLPVEVMLTVRERTALQYLIEPLTGSFRKALHEE